MTRSAILAEVLCVAREGKPAALEPLGMRNAIRGVYGEGWAIEVPEQAA